MGEDRSRGARARELNSRKRGAKERGSEQGQLRTARQNMAPEQNNDSASNGTAAVAETETNGTNGTATTEPKASYLKKMKMNKKSKHSCFGKTPSSPGPSWAGPRLPTPCSTAVDTAPCTLSATSCLLASWVPSFGVLSLSFLESPSSQFQSLSRRPSRRLSPPSRTRERRSRTRVSDSSTRSPRAMSPPCP